MRLELPQPSYYLIQLQHGWTKNCNKHINRSTLQHLRHSSRHTFFSSC